MRVGKVMQTIEPPATETLPDKVTIKSENLMFVYNNYDVEAGLARVLPECHVGFEYVEAYKDKWFIKRKDSEKIYQIKIPYLLLRDLAKTPRRAVKEVLKMFIRIYGKNTMIKLTTKQEPTDTKEKILTKRWLRGAEKMLNEFHGIEQSKGFQIYVKKEQRLTNQSTHDMVSH